MDPNEQEADQKLMQAEEVDTTAAVLESQGNEEQSGELEEMAQDMKEGAEQQKTDSEAQISESNPAPNP